MLPQILGHFVMFIMSKTNTFLPVYIATDIGHFVIFGMLHLHFYQYVAKVVRPFIFLCILTWRRGLHSGIVSA
jgi:hypothetical protein